MTILQYARREATRADAPVYVYVRRKNAKQDEYVIATEPAEKWLYRIHADGRVERPQ